MIGAPYTRYFSFSETEVEFEIGVPVTEKMEGKGEIDPAGAHHADEPDLRAVLQSGNSSQVSGPVPSPLTHETYDSETAASRHPITPRPRWNAVYCSCAPLDKPEGDVDLPEYLFVWGIHDHDGARCAQRTAKAVALAEALVHGCLRSVFRGAQPSRAVGAHEDAGPASYAPLFDQITNQTRCRNGFLTFDRTFLFHGKKYKKKSSSMSIE